MNRLINPFSLLRHFLDGHLICLNNSCEALRYLCLSDHLGFEVCFVVAAFVVQLLIFIFRDMFPFEVTVKHIHFLAWKDIEPKKRFMYIKPRITNESLTVEKYTYKFY